MNHFKPILLPLLLSAAMAFGQTTTASINVNLNNPTAALSSTNVGKITGTVPCGRPSSACG